MKAVVIEKFGGEEQLKMTDLPVPVPRGAEVLIEIKFSSVNPVDWKIREGMMKEMMPHHFPVTLGCDASGIVEAMAVNVSRFHVGDRVYAYCWKPEIHDGTYSDYIALDETKVAHMPRNLSFREAAAVPTAGLTAWQALFDHAQLQRGETVLIQGAAGGVGSFAIQFAKAVGAARVFAIAREVHHSYLLSIGADVVIDYSKDEVGKVLQQHVAEGVDVVIDAVGGKTLTDSFALIKPEGRLVSTVEEPDQDLAYAQDIKATMMSVTAQGEQLAEIAKLIEQGRVKPPRIEEYDLSQVAEAHKQSESHHTEGKLVLKVH
jgi:NADPH:quinone reductase-like Zn-dependent oxidoreductase